MKRLALLLALLCIPLLPALAVADDCVDVEIELNPTAGPDSSGLTFVEFSVELTNCGADPALISLQVNVNGDGPFVVPPFNFNVPVGAGATVARSWSLPLPPALPDGTYEVCVTATSGDATDSDCASVTVGGAEGASSIGSGPGQTRPTSAAITSDGCVDVEIELNPTAGPDSSGLTFVEFSIELTNCGTEPALIALQVNLSTAGPFIVPPFNFNFPVAAGATVARSWSLPIPPTAPDGTYEVCVTATSGDASDTDCASVTVGGATGTSSTGSGLDQNYPNPFNLQTGLTFTLGTSSDVTLKVHNLLGQEVATLAAGHLPAGTHYATWDGRNNNGVVVASGVYLYRLVTSEGVYTRKMTLLK